MFATASSLLTPTPVLLDGIHWKTFQALVADLTEEQSYRISYAPEQVKVEPFSPEANLLKGILLLKDIRWSTYRLLMTDVGENRAWRIAYAKGLLELRMPSQPHEQPKVLLASLIETLADEWAMEILHLGSLLLEREDLRQAIEPDTCFYIQNEALVRGKDIDLTIDPPPDLAVESDHTHSSLNKHDIYAALGVPELWRYAKQTLQVYVLVNGVYQFSDRSVAFPRLPIAEVPTLLEQSKMLGQRAALRAFRTQLREQLP